MLILKYHMCESQLAENIKFFQHNAHIFFVANSFEELTSDILIPFQTTYGLFLVVLPRSMICSKAGHVVIWLHLTHDQPANQENSVSFTLIILQHHLTWLSGASYLFKEKLQSKTHVDRVDKNQNFLLNQLKFQESKDMDKLVSCTAWNLHK